MRLRDILSSGDDQAVSAWWADWAAHGDASAAAVEACLSAEDARRSRRIRLATIGPADWVTGP